MYLHMHPKQFDDQYIIYIYIHLYTSIYIYNTSIYIYIHLYTSIYIYIHLYTSIYIYIYMNLCTKNTSFSHSKKTQSQHVLSISPLLKTEVDLTNSTAPPKHWFRPIDHGSSRNFSPEVGILKTEPLADAEAQEILWSTSEKVSIDEDLGMVWRAMMFVWKWELVGVLVGCCFEINKCQSGWMDHDDIICMFYVFLIMYPTAVFVYSLHCMKPTFDCVWWRWIHAR